MKELEDFKNFDGLYELLNQIKQELDSENNPNLKNEDNLFEQLLSSSFEDMDKEFIKNTKTQTVKIKKLNPDAVTPSYNYESDSGFDLYSVEEIIIPPLGRALIPTGLSFQFEMGYEIQVRTKSGLAINQGLMVLNSPGTVDQGYRGECKVPLFNTNQEAFVVKKGMKVAQAVLCPVVNGGYVRFQEMEELDEADRGDNGFGSTGILK